jgi:hypothetical protein
VLTLLSGSAVQAAAPAPTKPVLTAAEEPAVSPVLVSTEAPATPAEAPAAPAEASTEPNRITKEEATAIALADAGFSESQVTRLKAEFDYDDGRPEYEVEFQKDGFEYDYEIHAETSKILHKDKDWDD